MSNQYSGPTAPVYSTRQITNMSNQSQNRPAEKHEDSLHRGSTTGFGSTSATAKSKSRQVALTLFQILYNITAAQNILFMIRALPGQAVQAYDHATTDNNATIKPETLSTSLLYYIYIPAFFSVLFNVMLSRSSDFERLISNGFPIAPEKWIGKIVLGLSFLLTLAPAALTFGFLAARPLETAPCLPVLDNRTAGFTTLFDSVMTLTDLIMPSPLNTAIFAWTSVACFVMVTTPYYQTIYARAMSLLLLCSRKKFTPKEKKDIAVSLLAERFAGITDLTRLAQAQRLIAAIENTDTRESFRALKNKEQKELILKALADALFKANTSHVPQGIQADRTSTNRNLKDGITNTIGAGFISLLVKAIIVTGFISVGEVTKDAIGHGFLGSDETTASIAALFVNYITLMVMHIFSAAAITHYSTLLFSLALCIKKSCFGRKSDETEIWYTEGLKNVLGSELIKVAMLGLAYFTTGPSIANAESTGEITGAKPDIIQLMKLVAILSTMTFNSLGFPRNLEALFNYVREKCCKRKDNENTNKEPLIPSQKPLEVAHYANNTFGMAYVLIKNGTRPDDVIKAEAINTLAWGCLMLILSVLAITEVTATGVPHVTNKTETIVETACYDYGNTQVLRNITLSNSTVTCDGEPCPPSNYINYFPVFSTVMLLSSLAYAAVYFTTDSYYMSSEGKVDKLSVLVKTLSTLPMYAAAIMVNQAIASISTAGQMGDAPLPGLPGVCDNLLLGWYLMTTLMSHYTIDYSAGFYTPRRKTPAPRTGSNFGQSRTGNNFSQFSETKDCSQQNLEEKSSTNHI